MRRSTSLIAVAMLLASCGPVSGPTKAGAGASSVAATVESEAPFTITTIASFDEPWALEIIPGSPYILVTEKKGRIKLLEQGGEVIDIPAPAPVAYGGQGGMGDIVLAPDFATSKRIYYSMAAPGEGDTRGAAVGYATLNMDGTLTDGMVFWRQTPFVTGRGHYSLKLAFSPDGQHLYIASGDRQKMEPAQDLGSSLGKIVRLTYPGHAPAGAPEWQARGGVTASLWTSGNRNILGMAFDDKGQLWEVEHGPAGGDELNLVRPGANYGWPRASNGSHYDGNAIPDHTSSDGFAAPAISWNPVIAPAGLAFYKGNAFPDWRGDALIGGLGSQSLVRVRLSGEGPATRGTEVGRYAFENRIRDVAVDEAGRIWLIEDGAKDSGGGRLLRLDPK